MKPNPEGTECSLADDLIVLHANAQGHKGDWCQPCRDHKAILLCFDLRNSCSISIEAYNVPLCPD